MTDLDLEHMDGSTALRFAHDATDAEWFAASGECGGCGGGCGCGGCNEAICSHCPSRIREGWFCPPGCTSRHVDGVIAHD